MNNQFSVKEFATKMNCSKEEAYALLMFLKSQNLAQVTGKVKTSIGRGKPSLLYSVCPTVWDDLKNRFQF